MSALREARQTTNRAARTFSWACRLLPGPLRDDVYLLYLVFRTLDDLVDEGDADATARVAAVQAWARGHAVAPTREIVVLDELASRHPLPRDAFADFCAGMHDDIAGAEPITEADVDRYCYQVAGTVGVVMASVLGVRDLELARGPAAALGMAMQRTNILRDIDEDLAAGRVYVARESVLRFGGLQPGAREGLLRDQIARADALYEPRLRRAGPARQRAPRGRRRGSHVPRDPAPDRARRLRGPAGARGRPAATQARRRRAGPVTARARARVRGP